MRVVAALLDYPPHRFIGSELMTHSLLKRLQIRGHEVVVVGKKVTSSGWVWDGIPVIPRPLPDGDVLIYHAEFWEGTRRRRWVDGWDGPKVAVCHNSRMGVRLGLYNCAPDLVAVNSDTAAADLPSPSVVVHPPVPEWSGVSGDRVAVINMEKTSKVGPFWDLVRLMPDVEFLGVKGGYGKQSVPPGRLPRNVKVIDTVQSSQMDEVWSQVRVLLVPSATESWSMVASEAMAHGIPVIASPLPGLRENVGSAGLFADRANPQEWVDQIRHVLGAWDEFSDAARRRSVEQTVRHELEAEAWCDAVERLGNG